MRNTLRSVSVIFVVTVLSGCRVEVYDKLSQRDANAMTALLLNAGVDAKRTSTKDGTFAVTVEEDDFARAVTLIERGGLPKPEFASIVDVLNDDRLIASPSEERARLNYALSQELSRTVSEIQGVVSARVHLATPNTESLSRRNAQSSASVAIHHRGEFNTAGLVPRIKTLIANAVDGLDYDSVSIALFPAAELASDWSTTRLEVTDSFEDPTPSAPAVVSPAGFFDGRLNPMVAAVLAGGLIVLLLAGQTILAGSRRRKERASRNRYRDDSDTGARRRGEP